jgi:hypothetical protein
MSFGVSASDPGLLETAHVVAAADQALYHAEVAAQPRPRLEQSTHNGRTPHSRPRRSHPVQAMPDTETETAATRNAAGGGVSDPLQRLLDHPGRQQSMTLCSLNVGHDRPPRGARGAARP